MPSVAMQLPMVCLKDQYYDLYYASYILMIWQVSQESYLLYYLTTI